MNLDKKLELAHEFVMSCIKNPTVTLRADDILNITNNSWVYADAMEAEYNKRKQAEAEKNAKQSEILFEQLTKNKDGSCAHSHTTLNKTECFDCGSKLQDEFKVDWSVAPDWANWWMVDFKGCAFWDDGVKNGNLIKAPSFNYQGGWKDSLRKRP